MNYLIFTSGRINYFHSMDSVSESKFSSETEIKIDKQSQNVIVFV